MGTQITTLSTLKAENTIIKIRKYIVCFLVVFLLTTIIGTIVNTPEAATVSGSGYNTVYKLSDGTELKVNSMQNRVFGGAVMKFAYWLYGDQLASLGSSKLLTIDTTSKYWTAISDVYDTVAAVGVGIALLFCLMDLIDKFQMSQVSNEFMLKLGIRFTLICLLVGESGTIATGMIGLANGLLNDIVTAVSGTGSLSDSVIKEIYERCEHANFLTCLGELMELLVPALIMLICYILMYALLAGRLIEVSVRYVLFPIGVADAFSHGLSSPGMRYIKKLFAVAFQGAGMYLVVVVGTALMGMRTEIIGSSNPVLDAVFPVIIGITMVGAMLKVSSIIDDVAGVR